MRLLLVSYLFPPIGGMTPQRVVWLARQLARHHEVHVLTTRTNKFTARLGTDHESISLLAGTSVFVCRAGYPLLVGLSHSPVAGGAIPSHRGLGERVRSVLKSVAFPDAMAEWIPLAMFQASRLAAEYSYDAVVSFGYPFTCHLVGYALKRVFGVRWLADYGDPWSFNPDAKSLPSWRRRVDSAVEGHVLSHCDAVIVSTNETREGYRSRYPDISSRIYVVENGVSKGEMDSVKPRRTSLFRMLYTGRVYDWSPLEAIVTQTFRLRELGFAEPEVMIVGSPGGRIPLSIANSPSDVVSFTGYLPHREVLALQQGASVLVFIGAAGGLQIRSKLMEYIAARRPILAICDEHDPAVELIRRYRRGIIVNSAVQVGEAVTMLYDKWKDGTLDSSFDLELRDYPYWWETLAEKYSGILERIMTVCDS